MTDAPHVLMTADAMGGVWTYALDLGRGLRDAGVRVTLAVLGPGPDDGQLVQAAAAGLDVEFLSGALDWTARHKGEVAASAARLFQLTARLRPDLVHLNSPALAAFGPFHAPVLAACHSCVKTWWRAVKGDAPLPDDLAWRAALVELGYANAAVLMAPSRAFAEATQAAYGLEQAPHVVPNGRALLPCAAGEGDHAARVVEGAAQAHTSGGGKPPSPPFGWSPPPASQGEREDLVLTAGRLWDEGKDVATLDRAIGRSGMTAAAAGPLAGPNGPSIPLQHIRPLGRLREPELQARLARRPIFVSPSLYEPFGLAVLEAAQAGCPLVLADIATFRELWDGAALFFPAGDDAALAARLADLAADRTRAERLGDAARARAARYTATAMTDATRRLYATLSPAFAHPTFAHGEAAA